MKGLKVKGSFYLQNQSAFLSMKFLKTMLINGEQILKMAFMATP